MERFGAFIDIGGRHGPFRRRDFRVCRWEPSCPCPGWFSARCPVSGAVDRAASRGVER
ncbi:hypothetical protein [Streptomyces sp. CLV115]|uniref:hypothetical protein n=1 Tax=Streptomyces sp. CLV115 TaxID=3138502 RepID=UPI00406D24D0